MAVTNFPYITRMNSGFKVYILEGMSVFASARTLLFRDRVCGALLLANVWNFTGLLGIAFQMFNNNP